MTDFRDYIVVRQFNSYEFEYTGEEPSDRVKDMFPKEQKKTFWLVKKDGTFVRRYSVNSAPRWVKNIINQIN